MLRLPSYDTIRLPSYDGIDSPFFSDNGEQILNGDMESPNDMQVDSDGAYIVLHTSRERPATSLYTKIQACWSFVCATAPGAAVLEANPETDGHLQIS